jgi:hypothetical protein
MEKTESVRKELIRVTSHAKRARAEAQRQRECELMQTLPPRALAAQVRKRITSSALGKAIQWADSAHLRVYIVCQPGHHNSPPLARIVIKEGTRRLDVIAGIADQCGVAAFEGAMPEPPTPGIRRVTWALHGLRLVPFGLLAPYTIDRDQPEGWAEQLEVAGLTVWRAL